MHVTTTESKDIGINITVIRLVYPLKRFGKLSPASPVYEPRNVMKCNEM